VRIRSTILALALALSLFAASPAAGWNADFFEKDASGNATYEEMAISPEAVFDQDAGALGRTILTYQGAGLDPYVMSYDHATGAWDGPYRIAGNDLKGDTHGGPALVIDQDGYYYVFFGGHGGALAHARSAAKNDISAWVDLGSVRVGPSETAISATYPQAFVRNDGALVLYYRRDDTTSGTKGDWESIVSTAAAPAAPDWIDPPEMIISGDYSSAPGAYPPSHEESKTAPYYWYANVADSGDGLPKIAAVRRDYWAHLTDPYARTGVYYLEKHSSETTWTSAAGLEIDPRLRFKDLETTAAVLPKVAGEYTNQVVVRTDSDGQPAVLYLWGTHDSGDPYEWRFARPSGASWTSVKIAETDNFFDAGTFEFLEDGSVEAFLTTGDAEDDQWLDDPATALDEGRYDTRGGDITRWVSTNGGATWPAVANEQIIASPGPHARYNNPQIVRDDDGEARLLFSEWNNDASNFIHKVYLWGDEGFKQRSFTPEIARLAGTNRLGTAIEISKQGFPAGATTAVLASAANFPDVLCGVPLAQAYRAPVLLSNKDTLDPALKAELQRLGVSQVVILGGEGAVAKSVETAIRGIKNNGSFVKTKRISGRDRYVTSSEIAKALAAIKGAPQRVVLASGENFADALSVSPYAARRGYPVMLTPRASTNTTIAATIDSFAPETLIVVGGNAAVDPLAVSGYEAAASVASTRWEGPNRFATARVIAEHAIAEGHSMERFSLATGDNFADAVGGGLFAARMNSVMVITPSSRLHGEAERLINEQAFGDGTGVITAYILGGPAAVSPEVANALAARLSYLDAEASRER